MPTAPTSVDARPERADAAGRIALVTGGNRGLGLATVTALADAGATVVLAARDEAAARVTAGELRARGLDVETVALDVDALDVDAPDGVAAAAARVEARHGRLDILVNNAGVLPEASAGGSHEFADLAVFAATFRTNLFGPVAVIEAFLPLLRRSAGGRIVNVSTTMGSLTDQSDPNSPYYRLPVPAYRSSKAALNSVTIGLSKLLAGSGIKVTSVCPGWVQTDLAPGNREQAPLTPAEAARVVVHAATLPASAASGTFIDAGGTVAW
jgi:NAD(P)-dependent dehydrogenase (short-subunit alcohol dehydrogenase family)